MADHDTAQGARETVFSLTQIRHLMRVEFSRAQRYGYPVTCLVIACDGLDSLRDAHGYELKESVLEEVMGLLQGSSRACDYLGRMMDDRLMGVLPHTGREGGEAVARRLVEEARGLAVESGEGRTATLSIGLSHFEDDNVMYFDSLVQAAEEALEEARSGGGDRAVYKLAGPSG